MLNLYIHKSIDSEYVAMLPAYFEAYFKPEWLSDPDIIKAIESIDNIEYLGKTRFDSPVLGIIDIKDISGTSKCLVSSCIHKDLLHPIGWLGQNACSALAQLSEKYDMLYTLGNNGFQFNKGHKIHVMEWDEIVDGADLYQQITKHDSWDLVFEGLTFNITKEYL